MKKKIKENNTLESPLCAVPEETAEVEETEYSPTQEEISGENPDSTSLNKALDIISDEFNLRDKDYVLTAFDDKVSTIKLTMVNPDYEVTVKIRDVVNSGIIEEQ